MDNYLNNFYNVITSNINSNYLTHFYDNFKTIQVKTKKSVNNPFTRITTAGNYNCKKNIIILYDTESSVIYHELLHMASSWCNKYMSCSGFYTDYFENSDQFIGYGINEGYTELLAKRYFDSNTNISGSYQYLTYIAMMLELLVGKDNMQKYYFEADLDGLVNDLSKYSSKDAIIDFLYKTDYLYCYLDRNISIRKKCIMDALKDIKVFLASSYAKKLAILYQKQEINKEEIVKKLSIFNDMLINNEEENDNIDKTNDAILDNYLKNILLSVDSSIINDYRFERVRLKHQYQG